MVEGALKVIDLWADMDAAGERLAIGRGEFWQGRQCEINFCHGANRTIVARLHDEVGFKMPGIEQCEQRLLRIDVRDDGISSDLFAALENDSGREAVFCKNLRDGSA